MAQPLLIPRPNGMAGLTGTARPASTARPTIMMGTARPTETTRSTIVTGTARLGAAQRLGTADNQGTANKRDASGGHGAAHKHGTAPLKQRLCTSMCVFICYLCNSTAAGKDLFRVMYLRLKEVQFCLQEASKGLKKAQIGLKKARTNLQTINRIKTHRRDTSIRHS